MAVLASWSRQFKDDRSGISNYLQRWDGKQWVTVDMVERSVGP